MDVQLLLTPATAYCVTLRAVVDKMDKNIVMLMFQHEAMPTCTRRLGIGNLISIPSNEKFGSNFQCPIVVCTSASHQHDDILVHFIDDCSEGNIVSPALTAVRQPLKYSIKGVWTSYLDELSPPFLFSEGL
jgi:hypothetical protein